MRGCREGVAQEEEQKEHGAGEAAIKEERGASQVGRPGRASETHVPSRAKRGC